MQKSADEVGARPRQGDTQVMKRIQRGISRRENAAFYFILRLNDAKVTGKIEHFYPAVLFLLIRLCFSQQPNRVR